MRTLVRRSAAVAVAAAVVGIGTPAGVAAASTEDVAAPPAHRVSAQQVSGGQELHTDEMPEQKTTASTCATLERQGPYGYAMVNRKGVSRVYEFAGYSTDPQGYRDMRVNVYVDEGNWIMPGGWSKGPLLGFTFIGCS